jgi:hypothetical protein
VCYPLQTFHRHRIGSHRRWVRDEPGEELVVAHRGEAEFADGGVFRAGGFPEDPLKVEDL